MDDSYFFPYLMPLAEKHGIISYTQGFTGAHDLKEILKELEAVLGQSEGRRVVVLGHSWGATLILEYLRRLHGNGTIPSALILCSWLYDLSWQRTFDPLYVSLMRRKKLTALKWESDTDYHESMLGLDELYFSASHLHRGCDILGRVKYNAGIYLRMEKELLRDLDHADVVKSLKMPTLSLVGANDAITNAEYVRRGAELNPLIRHVEIKGAGHFPFVENPGDTLRAILGFI
jgi:pimeloyl-ACP methyl ester carboxylesterase